MEGEWVMVMGEGQGAVSTIVDDSRPGHVSAALAICHLPSAIWLANVINPPIISRNRQSNGSTFAQRMVWLNNG